MKYLWDVCRILSLLLLASHAWAGTGLTYHGRILKPDGSALEGAAVQFTLQIRSPGNESCLLYQETQTINMSDSGGAFSLEIGADPTYRVAASIDGGYSLSKVFANNSTLTLPSCAYGSTYTPNTADSRLLYISFNDGSGAQNLTAQKINYVPYAIESMQVNGYKANQLLRVDTGSAPVLTSGNLTVLNDLFNGVLTNSTTSLKLPTTVGTSGQVMQTDGSGNLSWVTPATAPTLTTASITTALGYTPLNKAGDTMSGSLDLGANNLINAGNISMASNKYLTLSANTTNGTVAGQMWYDTGTIKYFDGTSVRALGISGATPALTASDITGALGYTPASSATGYVNGGNTFGANATVGLNDAFKLGFRTNNTTQMTLDSNGNLGIGTASPGRKIHVQYTANGSDDGVIVDNLGNAGANLSLKSSGAGGHEYMMISTGSANSTGTGYFGIYDQNAVTYRMVISPTGNVGFGTAAPAYTLDLGSRTDALRLPSGADATRPTNAVGLVRYNTTSNVVEYNNGSAWIALGSGGGSLPAIAAGQVWVGNASGAAQALSLSGDVSSVSNTGAVTILKTTTGASNQIVALDNFGTTNIYGLGLISSVSGGMMLKSAASATNYTLAFPAAGPSANQILQSDASGNLSWINTPSLSGAYVNGGNTFGGNASIGLNEASNLSFVTNSATRMTIAGGGNVGIATTSPSVSLDISGATDAVRLPVGTTAQRPSNATGLLRYNSTNSNLEFNTGSGWSSLISSSAGSAFVNGGNSFSGAATLGTNDNNNLNFEANNTTIMTIKPGGTIGINTNNQSATLAIAKSTAPTTITAVNSYLHLGADEQNSNSYRLISFGYKTLEDYPAAYMGFQETSTSNSSRGDLVFGARSSTIDVAPVEIMRLTSAGNLSLPKAGTRILSDFTNATVNNRTLFQTSTTDQNTVVGAIPNNSGSTNANPGAGFQVFNNANPTNAAVGMIAADQSLVYFASNITGTGTALPMAFILNNSEKMRIQTDGSIGIGTSSPNARFQVTRDFGTANGNGAAIASFQGNNVGDQNYYLLSAYHGLSWRFLLDGTGNANFAGTVSQSSDLRLKRDVTAIDGALEKLSPIHGVNYYWKDPTRSTQKQLGVIAQEVEKSFPEAISEDQDGFKTVNYTGLIGPIIQAIKEFHSKWFVDSSKIHAELIEQKRAISSLEEQNKLLKSALCEKDPSYSFCQQ